MDRKTEEIVDLAKLLIKIPSVTVGSEERLDEVKRAADLIVEYIKKAGLHYEVFDQGDYPGILIGFPEGLLAPVMLSGHYDVVAPEPDDTQFAPIVQGDYLVGRGAADMKTVVATYLVWMKDTLASGSPYPKINLLLVGNEENGEAAPMGTPHILNKLKAEKNYSPSIFIAGERTEEKGDGIWGEICVENRGVARFQVFVKGEKRHSGMAPLDADLTHRLIQARVYLSNLAEKYLTLTSDDGWQSQIRFPFVQVGTPGVYNVTAETGVLGVEIRVIPQDDLASLYREFENYCERAGLYITDQILEAGIKCDSSLEFLSLLIDSVHELAGEAPKLGKKLAGTSARFAPNGNGVIWGQSGIGPHSKNEKHFIPSIKPYYDALVIFGKKL